MRKILLLLLCIAVTPCAQVNPDHGLVSYYPFSGNTNEVTGRQ